MDATIYALVFYGSTLIAALPMPPTTTYQDCANAATVGAGAAAKYAKDHGWQPVITRGVCVASKDDLTRLEAERQ